MAIQVYKPGNTHTVRGVECEALNINIGSLSHYLENGYYKKEGEWLEAVEDEVETEDEPQVDEPVENKRAEGVREKAKAAGIEGFDKKRIKTLESELNGLENKSD